MSAIEQEPSLSVLFVDDEPLVLAAMRRNLRSMSDRWEMSFADSGHEALGMLEERPYDAIVSDMRMPGMDGAELLGRVRKEYPSMIRLVLSGYSEQELTMKLVNTAHQYLSKPCNPEELKATLVRAVQLRRFLSDPGLQALVSRVHRLPSPPTLYQQVVEKMADPHATIEQIAQLIQRDPAMSGKILQLVNSSFFGMARHVSDVTQAVGLLGLNLVNSLILTIHIFTELPARPTGLRDLWQHSFRTGQLARKIMATQTSDKRLLSEAFTAGVLHDVGKLLLATELPMHYGSVVAEAIAKRQPAFRVECEHLGATHAQLGGYLLGLWNLPDGVIEAVAYHHSPASCPRQGFGPLTAVHVADALDRGRHMHETPSGPVPQIDWDYLSAIGMAEHAQAWPNLLEDAPDNAAQKPAEAA